MRFATVTLVLLLQLLLLTPVGTFAAPTDQPTEKNSESKPLTILNGVTRTAGNAGVQTCLERIDQVSNFVSANTKSKFLMFLPATDANRQMTSVSFEVLMPDQKLAYASMSAAPAPAGCDALYETVVYWEDTCQAAAAKGFADARVLGVIQKDITVLDGGPNLRIFMMPAGQGCISIKKEVIF